MLFGQAGLPPTRRVRLGEKCREFTLRLRTSWVGLGMPAFNTMGSLQNIEEASASNIPHASYAPDES